MDDKTNSGADKQGQGEKTVTEEFRVSGEALTAKIRELLREGNVRRIVIKNEEGKTLTEIPLTVGVVGALLLPVWAGVGAIAALAANLNLSVERRTEGVKLAEADIAMSDTMLGKAPSNPASNSTNDAPRDMSSSA